MQKLGTISGYTQLATLLKKRFWHKCFLVNFSKFLGTTFLQNTSGRLLLYTTFTQTCMNIKHLKIRYYQPEVAAHKRNREQLFKTFCKIFRKTRVLYSLICEYLCFPAPGPGTWSKPPAPNLYFTAPVLNFCLPVLRFTVEVCHSYSVYLYKPYS